MIRTTYTLPLLAAGVFAACAPDVSAQTKSIAKSYSRSVGNGYLGLTGYAYGYMRAYKLDPTQLIYTGYTTTYASAHARGYLRATAKILNSTRELGRFDVRGDVYSRSTGVSSAGSYRLLLAGKTMVSKSFSATTSFPRFSQYMSLFPVDPRVDVPVGPFTLRLKGNAGVGIESTGFAMLTASPAVGLSFATKAWGQGKASVEFGIFGFAVGASVIARLAEQTLGTNLWSTQSSIRGSVDYYMVALRLKLQAYAHALWGLASYSKTLIDKSWGSLSTVLFKI